MGQQSIPPIGEWREHLPYRTGIDVEVTAEKIYCATPFSLFVLDKEENSLERWSKINGLHETGISCIGLDPVTQKLLVAYTNSDLDLIDQTHIINIPDIKREAILGDKTIYDILFLGSDFYLSTGLGIIRINPERNEVRETWFFGNAGNFNRVNALANNNEGFYAATANGLFFIDPQVSNPSDYTRWQNQSGTHGLPPGSCRRVVSVSNRIFAWVGEAIFRKDDGGQWQIVRQFNPINQLNASGNLVLVSEKNATVAVLNADGALLETQNAGISNPLAASWDGIDYWVADQNNALVKTTSGNAVSYRPASPDSIVLGKMKVVDGVFYAASGNGNANGVFQFKDRVWTNYHPRQFSILDSLPNMVSLEAFADTIWAGSSGGGLARIAGAGEISIFKQNSSLQSPFRVGGLIREANGNLWVTNDGSPAILHLRSPDGNWQAFTAPLSLNQQAVSDIRVDDFGQKWILSPAGNGLICFRDGGTPANTGDDLWRLFRAGSGAGNLPSNNVLSIAIDKSGFIWVGTDDGMAVIQCPGQVFSAPGCEAILPIVLQGNFAGFLFKGESVRSIAVDGADRKWVATSNGVFLISSTGEEIIYQFTETNSPLPDNNVLEVAIDGKTGEVYFATEKGVFSYRSTATEGAISNTNVLIFPNPVPPQYSGTIGIRGLAENSFVKITELDGRLVFQTRALGGQAIWDGKDYRGRRISSGVYLVLVSDGGKEKFAGKIVVLKK